jgi:ribose transport system ATP-binding protein
MRGIAKRFPGVLALSQVDLDLYPGEVLALIGENGAGKSTLMRILAGIEAPDAGIILIDGQPVRPGNVREALGHGVAVIHQELNLAGNLDIASNIMLGAEPTGLLAVVKREVLRAQARRAADTVGLQIPLSTIVDDLPTAQRQLVEIARALAMSSRILVLDEPTSSLSDKEAQALFAVMRSLKARGTAMIYISHRLGEIMDIADRAVVLRDGKRVGELQREQMDRGAMVRLMVGRDVSRLFPESAGRGRGGLALAVRDLRCPGLPGSFTFAVGKGEVLGLAGLVGAGRTELVRALFGVQPPTAGSMEIDGREVNVKSPRDAARHGVMLVPEDRKELGLLLEMTVKENIVLPRTALAKRLTVDRKGDAELAARQSADLSIKTPSVEQIVRNLSGGNQQKVALAKWLALSPKVLILDEPTRGIDVAAKQEIHKLMRSLADSGVAVIMVSSEMEEVIGLSDRVLVMHEGAIQGELSGEQMTEENIMRLATGGAAA